MSDPSIEYNPGDAHSGPPNNPSGAPVLRDAPKLSGNVLTPSPGDVLTTDVWQEVWEAGANEPTFELVAHNGETYQGITLPDEGGTTG